MELKVKIGFLIVTLIVVMLACLGTYLNKRMNRNIKKSCKGTIIIQGIALIIFIVGLMLGITVFKKFGITKAIITVVVSIVLAIILWIVGGVIDHVKK